MIVHAPASISPKAIVQSFWRNRELIYIMTRKDVIGRYRGSVLGTLWSFVHPLILLAMYTFVFSIVFKAKWGNSFSDSQVEFAVYLFSGMLIHAIVSETLTRSPSLITANVVFVKKIQFPLEILPIVTVGTALFHGAASLLVLFAGVLFCNGTLPVTAFFLPLVLLPLVVMSLGFSWLLSSLGVYFRDISHPVGLLMTVLLFGSPVFYPVSALPEKIQTWVLLNPLTFAIEEARRVIMEGVLPNFQGVGIHLLVSAGIAWLGFAWFQKTRKGFANVL